MSVRNWQQGLWQRLLQDIAQNRMPHAMLFHGPDYSQAKDLALELGKRLLCEFNQEQACGQCNACRQLAAGANPDWLLVQRQEDKREILIDQIRSFCAEAQLTPSGKHGRVGLLLDADCLNQNAANALLKTLEEPPGQFTILLTAQRLSRVLPTIRSRCRCIAMPEPSEQDLRASLGDAAQSLVTEQLYAVAAIAAEPDAQQALLKKQQQWANLLQKLGREHDPLDAAAEIAEDDFDVFLDWWQRTLLAQMRAGTLPINMKRLWDATTRLRRQGQGGNFKRLLALEGLFILYLQLLQTAKQGIA